MSQKYLCISLGAIVPQYPMNTTMIECVIQLRGRFYFPKKLANQHSCSRFDRLLFFSQFSWRLPLELAKESDDHGGWRLFVFD